MKKILLVTATLLLAHGAFSQGTIVFNNHAGASTTAAPGIVNAAIFGPENNDPAAGPSTAKTGNTVAGNPMGTQTYTGAPLFAGALGGTWTATLWALDSQLVTGDRGANNLALVGTTTFRTVTSGAFAGTVIQPAAAVPVPGVATAGQLASFQLRVWDTKGGTIATWAQVLQNPNVLRGESDIFTVKYALGGTASPPNVAPFLEGLQSFNVYTAVPEPSVIALGALGAGCLLLLRRRK
jgi:hypothetical protein